MKLEPAKNQREFSQAENALRKKIREILKGLVFANSGEHRVAEEWLYQKFLAGWTKPEIFPALRGKKQIFRPQKAVQPQDARLMPRGQRVSLNYHPEFSNSEFEKLSFGLLPSVPGDKWLISLDDEHLCFFRSGTRVCLYEAKVQKLAHGCRVKGAWVDRAFLEQNEWNSPAYAERLLDYLIRRLLLGAAVAFPYPAGVQKALDRSMLRLGLVGKNLIPEE